MPAMEEVQKGKTPVEQPEAEPRLKGGWVIFNVVVLLALVGGSVSTAIHVVETGIMAVVVGIGISRARAARRSPPVSPTPISKDPMQAQQSCT